METPVAFHLSLPVRDLDETRAFYCGLLGATPGRATAGWIDLIVFGHQLTFHAQPDQVRAPDAQGVQHFGAILPWPAWEALCRRVADSGYPEAEPPRRMAQGTPQEHGKLLLRDPSGHLVELKAYREPARVLAPRPMRTWQGRCHCGAVHFEIDTDFPELTTCDCSLCRRRNALMVKVHEDRFRLLSGAEALAEYQFHTRTARHYFCKVCGIYPFHRKRVTPDHFGVNVHCLEGFDPAGIPVRATVGAGMP